MRIINLNHFFYFVLLFVLLLHGNAHAQATAKAKLEHFRVQLIDLDTADDITPAIIYGGVVNYAGLGVQFQDDKNQITKSVTDIDWGHAFPTQSLSAAYNNGISFASANSIGSVFNPDGVTASLYSTSFGSPSSVKSYAEAGMNVTNEWFFVTPKTKIEFSADAYVEAERTPTPAPFYEAASGLVFMNLRGTGASDIFEYTQAYTGSDDRRPLFVNNGRNFTISYSNPRDELGTLQFVLGFSAATWSNVPSVVPEPDIYAAMLAGLMLIGYVRLRWQPEHGYPDGYDLT